ncbi:hypothetical protein ACFOWZ_05865 [Lentzea rhizosphaerae]|uniref:D-alanyl-D-alanine dipeptidase n=1 Tax=Lentzea rhizosphaerae TaxID=2041025 RepID=A0ABV8BN21_9PSEU
MIVLPPDPCLAGVPVRDNGEVLVEVRTSAPLRTAGPVHLRSGLVDRLVTAQTLLPREVRLLIVDGYRPPALPCRNLACALDPGSDVCATPPGTAPHLTGGAVDLTLANRDGRASPGTPLPACGTGPIPPPHHELRHLLSTALGAAGLANHPARWWHWSYGDRFWASVTHAPHARYGCCPP